MRSKDQVLGFAGPAHKVAQAVGIAGFGEKLRFAISCLLTLLQPELIVRQQAQDRAAKSTAVSATVTADDLVRDPVTGHAAGDDRLARPSASISLTSAPTQRSEAISPLQPGYRVAPSSTRPESVCLPAGVKRLPHTAGNQQLAVVAHASAAAIHGPETSAAPTHWEPYCFQQTAQCASRPVAAP